MGKKTQFGNPTELVYLSLIFIFYFFYFKLDRVGSDFIRLFCIWDFIWMGWSIFVQAFYVFYFD